MEEKKNTWGGVRQGAGRPKGSTKENKRNKNLGIRITEEELNLISECAKKLGTSQSNAIITAVKELLKTL